MDFQKLSIGAPAQMQQLSMMDPSSVAQLQVDQQDYQRKQQLAQAMLQGNYVNNSGKAGLLGSILSSVGGAFLQHNNNAKVADLIQRQVTMESQAAQAKRKQDIEDEQRKMMEEMQKGIGIARGTAQAQKEFAKSEFKDGMVFDPSTNTTTAAPGYMDSQIALAGGKAKAEAAARAQYAGAAGAAGLGQIKSIMGMEESPLKQALLTKALGEGGMQAMQMASMGAGGGMSGGPSGDDFLKTLNPGMAGQVKAIVEGRQAPPTGMAMRTPMGQALMSAVQQADPTFDATSYAARSKARNDLTSGKGAQTLNSINTAIGHAGELYDVASKLDNTSMPAYNSVANWVSSQTGDPRVTAYNQTRDALVGELTKAFRGSSGNKADIEEATKNLSAAGSPDQQKAAIGQAMKLLSSKATALQDQYSQAFAGKSAPNFLDPHAQAALQKMAGAGIDTGFDTGQSDQPASPTIATATAPDLAALQAEARRRGLIQ